MYIIALVVAFILELVAFTGFASVGYLLPLNNTVHVTLFILLLVLVITFWGFFMAPKAPKKFKITQYYIAKLTIYTVSAISIFGIKGFVWGVSFIVAIVIDELLLYKHNIS